MDDIFIAAIQAAQDPDCDLSIEFNPEKPIIEKYSATCFSEYSGLTIDNFYDGHQVSF